MSGGGVDRIYGPFERARVDLELRGAHHPYVVADRVGRWWVCKPLRPRGVLGECVGALLGRELGVDVPDFAIFDEGDLGRGWLSAFVRDAHHWDHLMVGALVNSSSVGRMLALDAIIHNEDRNTENFIFEIDSREVEYRCWTIDMESALVGMPRALAVKGLGVPSPHALPREFELDDAVCDAARAGAMDAAGLSDGVVREVVAASVEAAGTLDREILADALLLRCRHASQIVEQYLDEIDRR